ncbi:MAG TPA: class I adenylate-forming enzyme family protein [Acidimicrobiales bacterium]|nr:class I adenylate-forming enzyme family protein [Acidimicrobiales bacterium]
MTRPFAGLDLPVPLERLTLGRFVTDVATASRDREALAFGGHHWTYAEVEQGARAFAGGLLALGLPKGAKVALLLGSRPEFVSAAFGTGMVGGVVVPISTLATVPEREYILRHSDASVLVVQPELRGHRFVEDLLAAHPAIAEAGGGPFRLPELPHLRHVVVIGDRNASGALTSWDAVVEEGRSAPDGLVDASIGEVHPADDAIIVYTSGTTAVPKAVVHMHRAPVVQFYRFQDQMRLEPTDRVWSSFPFFWTAGLAMALGGTLAAGACLVMQETFDAGEALRLIEQERVTTVHAFDHASAQLADHPDRALRDTSSVRKIRAGTPFQQAIGVDTSEWDMRAAYGLTETFTMVTSIPATRPHEERMATHGTPLPGMQIRILDPESGVALPEGGIGEIAVKGITLMRGYYKSFPEEAFDPDGWFRTGDAGWIGPDGHLHWTGRLDNLVKTAGANVSAVEVETEAMFLGGLAVASVVGVPHPTLGQAVVLCAVPRPGAEVDGRAVAEQLRGRLASYKIPRVVLLFEEAELQFTGSDKVRTERLRELAVARMVEAGTDEEWVTWLRGRSPRPPEVRRVRRK